MRNKTEEEKNSSLLYNQYINIIREEVPPPSKILLVHLISRASVEEFAFSARIPAERFLKPVIAHTYAQL